MSLLILFMFQIILKWILFNIFNLSLIVKI